jgi:DNA-binding response OmpR family regulator
VFERFTVFNRFSELNGFILAAMNPASDAPAGVAFGRFRVLPHRREVCDEGQPIKLGGRAFDVLMALIEARGAIVAKDALMARVWADQVVEGTIWKPRSRRCARPSARIGI